MRDDRYHRQMLLPEWGSGGQAKLHAMRAVIVGCGALGCVTADLLTRAGVGSLTLIDRDVVELTNLQRQMLFTEADATDGMPKAEAAKRHLVAVNSGIEIEGIVADLNATNAQRLIPARDNSVIIDGTDNFETRFLLNDLAVQRGTPYVYGGAVGTRGMACVVDSRDAARPCLRCLFRDPPPPGSQPTCDTAGVLGPLISVVAGLQAAEAMKLMLGADERVLRSLVEIDLWTGLRREIAVSGLRDPACPCCGERRFEFLESSDTAGGSTALCGRHAVQITPSTYGRIDLDALAARLASFGSFEANRFLVRGTLEADGVSLTVFSDGRAIVQGVTDEGRGKAIYARYVGA